MPVDFYRDARFARPESLMRESLWLTDRLTEVSQWTTSTAR